MNWQSGLINTILAQAAQTAGGAAAGGAAPGATGGDAPLTGIPALLVNLMPFAVILVFFYFVLLRPQNLEQKKRESLLNSLKKDDRVVTVGGILGTVANISANGKEVVLKMEDNSKIRILRSGIQAKLTAEETPESTGS